MERRPTLRAQNIRIAENGNRSWSDRRGRGPTTGSATMFGLNRSPKRRVDGMNSSIRVSKSTFEREESLGSERRLLSRRRVARADGIDTARGGLDGGAFSSLGLHWFLFVLLMLLLTKLHDVYLFETKTKEVSMNKIQVNSTNRSNTSTFYIALINTIWATGTSVAAGALSA
jgi:hypothetical protein